LNLAKVRRVHSLQVLKRVWTPQVHRVRRSLFVRERPRRSLRELQRPLDRLETRVMAEWIEEWFRLQPL
jgi:hypothetical protein